MILHCVFCNFRADVTSQQKMLIFQELRDFSKTLDGMVSFEFGPNRDFEKKSQEFSDGFVIRFTDQKALEAYAVHQTHQALGKRLCEFCNGGADGIIVFDVESG